MAITYVPNDALAYAKRFVKNAPIDNVLTAAQILDTSYRFLWMAAPWSWTLGALSIVTLSGGVQDYTATDPTDFLRLEYAGRTRSNDRLEGLSIVAALPSDTSYKQTSKKISIVSVAGGNVNLRLWPCPPTDNERVITLYKKTSVKITEDNRDGDPQPIAFPDEFFPIYQEIVLQKAFLYLQDIRAGSAQINSNGQAQYTGQLAVVMSMIEMYRRNEPTLLTELGIEARSEGSSQ